VTVSSARAARVGAESALCDISLRRIDRWPDDHTHARNHARSLRGTPEFERSSNARKKVEMRFAHLKVQHGFERMRLRGLTGARDEFHLAAIVQNLKTLALRLLGPPTRGTCAAIA
jgi:Transposase DDE domain